MRIMILDPIKTEETEEFLKQSPESKCFTVDFEYYQKDFDCIYCSDPNWLIDRKIQIPYFYDIHEDNLENSFDFKIFSAFYSKLQGAEAIFVSDKRLNKFAQWADLNSYWIPEAYFEDNNKKSIKKFLTPKLNIGVKIGLDFQLADLFNKICVLKKSNWNFYVMNQILCESFPNLNFLQNEDELLNFSQVYLNLSNNFSFPNQISLKALSKGCGLVSTNPNGNNNHILFDDVHYFKLDHLNANIIFETLQYIDKRREKIERVSIKGRKIAKQYFTIQNIVSQKIRIMHKELSI